MPNNNNHIVEIGPGLGDLTKKIVKYKDVTAYEVDSNLVTILKNKFVNEINSGKLSLIQGDVLDPWSSKGSLYHTKYDLIANLPYYIATNIILRAFEDINCENIMVMIQKEVAKKFSSTHKEKDFSSLGVITKLIAKEAEILFDVPASSFEPSPKVNSSILYIKKDMKVKIDIGFKKFLKSAFISPRKKLFKNLSIIINKSYLIDIYKNMNLNDNIRPHELSASLYSQMYKKVINNDK